MKHMQLHHIKRLLAGSWFIAIVGIGFAGDVASPGARIALAAFALLPPLALMRFWTHPVPTMSESINQARR